MKYLLVNGNLEIHYTEVVMRRDWQSGYEEGVTEPRVCRIPLETATGLQDFLNENLEAHKTAEKERAKEYLKNKACQLQSEADSIRAKLKEMK